MQGQAVVWIVGAMVVGVLVGAVLAWLLLRGRFAAEADAAVSRAVAADKSELATAQATSREANNLASSRLAELERDRTQIAGLLAERDDERDAKARIQAELSGRESELVQLRANEVDRSAELVRLREERDALRIAHDDATKHLAIATERASRIAPLEQQLTQSRAQLDTVGADAAVAKEHVAALQASQSALEGHLADTSERLRLASVELAAQSERNLRLSSQLATLEQQLTSEQQSTDEKLALLGSAQETLSSQFKLVANEVLEMNSKRFAEQSQENLGTILNPLREKLGEFQKKVEDVYIDEGKDRAALKHQVEELVKMNTMLSEDAKNLTSALRGSNKSQGNWGELILQRVLEAAGLREGIEYIVQDAQRDDDGRRQQPDIVINLPDDRRIVVDAKVSLVAFERASTAESDADRDAAIREHVASIRSHVRGLGEKRYDLLYDTSLDFVVMFVPIEPAFMLAVNGDEKLCHDAWDRNVLLVSPSTLLFVLRTVAYLWRQEAQTRNAKEIAKRGADLYDKLVSFVADLESVESKLNTAQQSFSSAKKRLSTGKGNLIRQAQLLRELGVKPTKALPKDLVEQSEESDEAETLLSLAAPEPTALLVSEIDPTT